MGIQAELGVSEPPVRKNDLPGKIPPPKSEVVDLDAEDTDLDVNDPLPQQELVLVDDDDDFEVGVRSSLPVGRKSAFFFQISLYSF